MMKFFPHHAHNASLSYKSASGPARACSTAITPPARMRTDLPTFPSGRGRPGGHAAPSTAVGTIPPKPRKGYACASRLPLVARSRHSSPAGL